MFSVCIRRMLLFALSFTIPGIGGYTVGPQKTALGSPSEAVKVEV